MHNALYSLDQISWMSAIHLFHQTQLSQSYTLRVLKCQNPKETLVKTSQCSVHHEEKEGCRKIKGLF